MNDFHLPEKLSDKIYEIKTDKTGILKLISYFPLSDKERNELRLILGKKFEHGCFHSIFSDSISDAEWEQSKSQIKKRFQDELFEID